MNGQKTQSKKGTHFPVATRRIVYATNSIENLNKMIRKATKNKLSFEKPSRLLDYLFVIIKEFEENNWMKYPVTTMNEWPKDTIEQRNPFFSHFVSILYGMGDIVS